MPLPTAMQVHVSQPLSNIAEKFYLQEDVFVADKVFPIVSVQKLTDRIARYCRKDWFNTTSVRPRAPGAKSQGVGFHVDLATEYLCREYATNFRLPDEVRANADAPLNLEVDAIQVITQRLKIKREEMWAAAAFVAGAWANAGVYNAGAWNLAASTPIVDVGNAQIQMALSTGFQPNTLVVNKQVFYQLRRNPSIVAVYRNLGAAVPMLTTQQVADALGVERLLVAKGVQDVGPMQGQWDGRWLLGNHALLCYTAPAPSTLMPSAGYTFSYTGANHTGTNIQIERYRGEEDSKTDIFVGNIHFDVQIVEPDLGVFFANAVAGAGILNQVVLDVPICL